MKVQEEPVKRKLLTVPSLGRAAILAALLFAAVQAGLFLLSRADGPFFIFTGGPFRSGEQVELAEMDWDALDTLHELELEIVDAESSLTLWFSVQDGVAYVACDLDCIDGNLSRWPGQIELDDRVVVRIEEKRADARLTHVPHGSTEYAIVRAGRDRKYAGSGGTREAAETAAHGTVVEVGEILTGRSQRAEPGDRLYRVDPP